MKRVVVIQKTLPHYRVPLFEGLKATLAEWDIDFHLIYSDPVGRDAARNDTAQIAWASNVPIRAFKAGGDRTLLWQAALRRIRRGDLVIVEQASKMLLNYLLFMGDSLGQVRLAFWGHGSNRREGGSSRAGESTKRFMTRRVDWWFAYTNETAEMVSELGYDRNRITVVQNAIDTSALASASARLSSEELADTRARLGVTGEAVGIFCGALDAAKGLAFLLEASDAIRSRVPDFELIVVGAGPDADVLRDFSSTRPWIKIVGPAFDAEKVPYFRLSAVTLVPFSVGLVVVDAFIFNRPVICVEGHSHGPEFDYLEDDVNARVLPRQCTPDEYAAAVAGVLGDGELRHRLMEGCEKAAGQYTMENMIQRFATGIRAALES